MSVKIGIDLGTTFSAVAIYDKTTQMPKIVKNQYGNHITPSVIQFCDDGEIIIGDEAKEAFDEGDVGCVTAFKRGMGDNQPYAFYKGKGYSAEELSAMLLKALKEDTEKILNDTIEEAVITVPAYFFHKERQATLNAAKKAGLKVRMLINEPTAAALNYGVNHWRENAVIMVYDLGGGTFDVTLLQMGNHNEIHCLKTMGNHILGGKDWDRALVHYLIQLIYSETGEDVKKDNQFMNELSGNVEKIKKDLTKAKQVKIKLRVPHYGVYETIITVEDFENLTHSLLDQTVTLCETILKESQMDWHQVTDILLVGGSTRMPQVSKYLEKVSGHRPLTQVNPDEAVALGAAIQTILPIPKYEKIQAGELKSTPTRFKAGLVKKEQSLTHASAIRVKDVQAHALGIIAVNAEGTHYENQNIIPANQEIPVKCAKKFQYYTYPNRKNEVDIYLLQGTKPILECEILNKYVISGIKHKEDGPTIIRIQYSYDASGLVHVQARQEDDQYDLPIREEPIDKDISRFGQPIPQEKITQEKVSVLFVIDTSGSMAGSRIDEAKLSIKDFVHKLKGKNVSFGILAFSSSITPIQSLTENRHKINKSTDSLDSGIGGCGTSADPFPAAQKIFESVKGRKIIIVLTDGDWYGVEPEPTVTADICKKNQIEIIAIGIGESNLEFLRKISSISEKALKINEKQLRQSFGNIAQTIRDSSHTKGKINREYSSVDTWDAVDE